MAPLLLLIALLGAVSPEHLSVHHVPVSLPIQHPLLNHVATEAALTTLIETQGFTSWKVVGDGAVCQQGACRLQFQKQGLCHGDCNDCYDSFVKECALKKHLCLHGPLHSHVLPTCKLCHVYFSHSHLVSHSVAPLDHVIVHHPAAVAQGDKCGSHDCQEQFIVTGHCWAKCIPCEALYGNRCRSQECEKQLGKGRLWGDCAICAKYLRQLLDGSEIILGKSKGRSLARVVRPLLQAQSHHVHEGPDHGHHVGLERAPPLQSFPAASPVPFFQSPGYGWYQPPGFYRGSFGSLQDFSPEVYNPSAGSEGAFADYDVP